jgi:hypothetical protein
MVRKLERRKPTIVIDGQLINEKSEREGKKERKSNIGLLL